MTLSSISLRARDVAERPGDVRLRRPAAERRHSNCSNPAGLEHTKRRHPPDVSFLYLFESTRRDSNSPNVGKATKIKEECTLSNVCLQAVYNLEIRVESCQGVCRADTFYPFTACYSGR